MITMATDDLLRAEWYARTADIMSGATIAANRRDLVAQLEPGFTWKGGRSLTAAERSDTERCLVILDREVRHRLGVTTVKKCPDCSSNLMDPNLSGTPGDDSFYCEACGTAWSLDLMRKVL